MAGRWLVALLLSSATAFYLPGLAPVTYCTTKVCLVYIDSGTGCTCTHTVAQESTTCSNDIKLFVNRLNSEESVIPYEYHHFDFCKADESQAPHENLGQVTSIINVQFILTSYGPGCLWREDPTFPLRDNLWTEH